MKTWTLMGVQEHATSGASSFWTNDDAWSVAWPAAIGAAMLFHVCFFMASQQAPVKVKQEPITMAIAMPPPPPPPPPEEPPPPPPPPPRKAPPPPNETPKDTPPEDVQPVTGVTADSVVAENTSGANVRVGNTTFGDPTQEPLTPPNQVAKPSAQPFDASAYRRTVFETMDHEKRYPRKARVLGLEGRCLVKLVINRDGGLAEEPKVVGKGTGHDVLDEECIRMAKAKQYPPIVGDVEVPYHLTIPISFQTIDP